MILRVGVLHWHTTLSHYLRIIIVSYSLIFLRDLGILPQRQFFLFQLAFIMGHCENLIAGRLVDLDDQSSNVRWFGTVSLEPGG